jgi:hypothetical protein
MHRAPSINSAIAALQSRNAAIARPFSIHAETKSNMRSKETRMMKSLLLASAGALMLGSLAIPASAAPAVAGLKTTGAETSAVDHVNYRRCWHRHGYLVCRRGYRYGYAPYYDDGDYGYGYGPGVSLYFGGGGGGWGGHRGHFGGHRR